MFFVFVFVLVVFVLVVLGLLVVVVAVAVAVAVDVLCVTTCVYYVLKGGLATRDEMCLSFVMYYPKVNLSQCVTLDLGFYKFYRKYFR